MSNLSPGDVGIEVTLNEQQAVDGAKRTSAALDELNQTVIKVGETVDQAMAQAATAVNTTAEATRKMTAEQAAAHDAARKAYDEHRQAVSEGKKATVEAADALGTFQERLAGIASERARALAGMGDELMAVQKQAATAQVTGDGPGAAQAQQRIIAMNREVVQAQRDDLAEMLKDEKLSDAEYEQVKEAQLKAEQKLRDLDVASHRAAEAEKVAISKQTAKDQVDAEKQALQDIKAAISADKANSFAGISDQLTAAQKQGATAQVNGDAGGAAQAQQQIIALNRQAVQSQREALTEMAQDSKLSAAQYEQLMQAQDQAEEKLRKMEVASHKAAEAEKVAASKQAAQEKADAEKQAAQAAADAAKQQQQALQDMKTGLMQVGAAAAAVGLAIKTAMDQALDAYKEQQTALKGLESMSNTMGKSFAETKKAATDLTQDGLLPIATTAKSMQQLIGAGFNPKQAQEMIDIAKNAAAYNSKGGKEMATAVEQFAEGVRLGNARMTQATGLSERLTTILKQQGIAQGELQNLQHDGAAREAILNGLREAGAQFSGDAARSLDTLAGAEARNTTATTNLKVAWGADLAPAMMSAQNAMVPLLQSATDWAKANPELARTIVLVVGGAAALTATVAGLTIAFLAMNLALGPIGWSIVGIAALAGAFGGLAVSEQAAARQQEQVNTETASLMRQYEALRRVIDDSTSSTDDKTRATQKLKDVIARLGDIQPQMKGWFDEEGRLLDTATSKWGAYKDAVINAEIAKARIEIADSAKQVDQLQTERAGAADKIRNDFKANVAYPPGMTVMGMRANNFGASPGLIDALSQFAEPALAEKITLATADIDNKLALAQATKAKAEAKIAALNAPMDKQTALGPAPTGGAETGPLASGANKMSAGLEKDMAALQDQQALDKTPENLRKTLAMVRQIINDHLAELEKLNKDHELLRLRDFTLPKEITAAEFTEIMRQLQHDEQMASAKGEPIKPEVIKERLGAVKKQFADYLAEHPDAAASIDVRLAGMNQEQAKKAVADALQIIENRKKFLGDKYDAELERPDVARIIPLASTIAGEDGVKQVVDLIGRLNQLDKTIEKARFDDRFKAIATAREQAFAGAAGALAGLNQELADEQAKGTKADPERINWLKQQMLDAVRPAIEAQKAALEQLLLDTKLTTDQRAQVERDLNGVKQQLYDQDTQAHQLALDAKVAAEKRATQSLQDLRTALRAAQQADLEQLKQTQTAEEKAQETRIKGLRDELKDLEKKWQIQDRLKKMVDLQKQLTDVKADTRFEKVGADGKITYTYDEAAAAALEKQIADQKQQDERQQQRDSLQGQIETEQQRLDAMRTAHQQAYTERQNSWQQLLALDDTQLAELVKKTDKGMGDGQDGWNGVLKKWLDKAVSTATEKAKSITTALQGAIDKAREAQAALSATPAVPAPTAPASPAGAAGTAAASPQGIPHKAFAYGGVADPSHPVMGLMGERVREWNVPEDYIGDLAARIVRFLPQPRLPQIASPTMPASLGAAVGGTTIINLGGVNITVKGGSDPQATAAAVAPAAARGVKQGLDAAAFNARIRLGTRTV